MVLDREAEEWVLRPTIVISTLGSLMSFNPGVTQPGLLSCAN